MSDFFTLEVDPELCKECGDCDQVAPEFRGKYGGMIKIAAWAYRREEIRMKIRAIMNSCKNSAIILR
jgi:hypothetical protein